MTCAVAFLSTQAREGLLQQCSAPPSPLGTLEKRDLGCGTEGGRKRNKAAVPGFRGCLDRFRKLLKTQGPRHVASVAWQTVRGELHGRGPSSSRLSALPAPCQGSSTTRCLPPRLATLPGTWSSPDWRRSWQGAQFRFEQALQPTASEAHNLNCVPAALEPFREAIVGAWHMAAQEVLHLPQVQENRLILSQRAQDEEPAKKKQRRLAASRPQRRPQKRTQQKRPRLRRP